MHDVCMSAHDKMIDANSFKFERVFPSPTVAHMNLRICSQKWDWLNIDQDELADFKKLAQAFGRMTDAELRAALNQGDLLELCDEE